MIKPADAIAAVTPPVATITMSQVNAYLGFVTGVVSLGYLLWRWRRDYHVAKREDAKGD